MDQMRNRTQQAQVILWPLTALARPITLNTPSRLRLLQDIEDVRGQQAMMTLIATQLLHGIDDAGMMPRRDRISCLVAKAGAQSQAARLGPGFRRAGDPRPRRQPPPRRCQNGFKPIRIDEGFKQADAEPQAPARPQCLPLSLPQPRRGFSNKLKHFRVLATRYEKRGDNFLASVQRAFIRIWLRHNESVA